MMKKAIFGSLATIALLFSACGDNGEATCRIDIQTAIDKGDYDSAIDGLEGSCATAYSQSDLNYNLATAYMGKAGYGVSDVLSLLIDAGNASSGSAFSTFTKTANGINNSAESAIYLDKAKAFYIAASSSNLNVAIATLCNQADLNITTDTRLSSSCLYLGFNQTLHTVNTIALLTKDVDTLVSSIDDNSANNTPLDMKVGLDALAWSTDMNNTLPNGSNITAVDVNISEKTYTHLRIAIKNDNNITEIFYRLAKSQVRDTNNSTILTNAYCDTNGSQSNCEGLENINGSIDINSSHAANCYACPIDFGNGKSQDISTLLVDVLNGGTDAIENVSNDADIQQSINDFKIEISGSVDANITIDDIIQYLNK